MPLDLPNLDDRRYKDLVAEALSLIPAYAPEWTNHNPSDPGITLVEMYAYVTEILIYRLNRITPANQLSFLKILNGSNWDPSDINGQSLRKSTHELTAEEIRAQIPITINNLRKLERAVSKQDFELLAVQATPLVARAQCVAQRNYEVDLEGTTDREGHISLIVLLAKEAEQQSANVLSPVRDYLSDRLLLTTRLHVIEAIFLDVTINLTVVLMPDQDGNGLNDKILLEFRRYFNPYPDESSGGTGWPWGRNVYISEIFTLVDQLPFIDYVKEENFTIIADRPGRDISGVGIQVKSYELVHIKNVSVTVTDK